MHAHRLRRIVLLLALPLAAACADRPVAPAGPRAEVRLDEAGDQPLVVGSSARGIARLEVTARPLHEDEGAEPRHWSFENALPEEEEAWGIVALPLEWPHAVTLAGFDRDGRERFRTTLGEITATGKPLPQRRAPVAGGEAGDVAYAGSWRATLTPRWPDADAEEVRAILRVHDAAGETLRLTPEDAYLPPDVPWIAGLDVHPDEVFKALVLTLHPPKAGTEPYFPAISEICFYAETACLGVRISRWPVPAARYARIVAARIHTCALRLSGLARCWGDDGDPLSSRVDTPADTVYDANAVLATLDLVDLDSERNHACAVERTGPAWCWGWNADGQLGTGAATAAGRFRPQPVAMPAVAGAPVRFRRIATGRDHSCALDEQGGAWCWGANGTGQLGDGAGGRDGDHSATPVRVAVVDPVLAIDAGDGHSCALTDAGAVLCWGANDAGQLGTVTPGAPCDRGGSSMPCSRLPVVASGGSLAPAGHVALGIGARTSCAVHVGGALHCWGAPFLGDGGATGSVIPVAVEPALAFAAVDVADRNGCAITRAGRARCWGENGGDANLGIGSASPALSLTPLLVHTPPAGFAQLSVGQRHTCGVGPVRDAMYCWGSWSAYGGMSANTRIPSRVADF